MGALLALLKGGAKEEEPIDIPVNLNAPVSPDEKAVYDQVDQIISQSQTILSSLKQYSGCGDAIRQAISNPGKSTEDAAWEAVSPAVEKLKVMYEYGIKLDDDITLLSDSKLDTDIRLDECVKKLLKLLASGDASNTMARMQASTKKLADILDFASQFDSLKMSNPNVQNDFSYYRRTVSRMKMNNAQLNVVVSDELANKMSLFFAHANPVTKALIDATNVAIQSKSCDSASATDVFAILAAISYNQVAKSRVSGDEIQFYLRVMVTSILIYDHIDTVGAFAKGSRVNVRASIKAIQSHAGSNVEALLNSLRYSSQHLNDETTPKAVKSLLVPS